MARIPRQSELDPIEYLVLRKYPGLSWRPPPSLAGVRTRRAPEDSPSRSVEEARAYANDLRKLPPQEIEKLVAAERQKEAEARSRAAALEEASRFYNQPNAQADWQHWARQSYWTVEDAVALSFGKDPRFVKWERLKSCTQIWEFAKTFEDRLDQFNRAVWAQQIWPRTYPRLLLAWADRMGFVMPPELVAAVEGLGIQIADWKTLHDGIEARYKSLEAHCEVLKQRCERANERYDEIANSSQALREKSEAIRTTAAKRADILEQRNAELEREILQLTASVAELEKARQTPRTTDEKIILAMAMAKYRFDSSKRNSAASNIASACAELGIPVSERSVRDRLGAAAKKFEAGEWER